MSTFTVYKQKVIQPILLAADVLFLTYVVAWARVVDASRQKWPIDVYSRDLDQVFKEKFTLENVNRYTERRKLCTQQQILNNAQIHSCCRSV